MPYVERALVERGLKFLTDTGAAKSYVEQLKGLKGIKPVKQSFAVKSIHGTTKIDKHCTINIFNKNAKFFILLSLDTFDGIIGFDLLKQVNGKIDLKSEHLSYDHGRERLLYYYCPDVNKLIETDTERVKDELNISALLQRHARVFADPKEALPYNTDIVGTIRTTDDLPIYSRSYPYPIASA